jgi:hypothetical protein
MERYVKDAKGGKLKKDNAKIKQEEKFDRKYLLILYFEFVCNCLG